VDIETGQVRVLRSWPRTTPDGSSTRRWQKVSSEGGIIQGLGYALFEEAELPRRLGIRSIRRMHDYKIPMIGDVPTIEAFFVTERMSSPFFIIPARRPR